MKNLIIAILVGILILAGIWYILRQNREQIEEATEYINQDGERTEQPHQKGSASIPISARARALSTTAKIMFGSIGLLILIIAIFVYQTVRTGSPAEVMFADQLETGAKVLIGVAVGVIGGNLARKNEGLLVNIYETDSGDYRVEELPVDIQDVDADDEGQKVVTEYKKRRVIGLFRRHKHVGEDPELEGTHRAPGKPVTHQIADHSVEIDDGMWVQRTEGRQKTTDPSTKPDYIYSAPVELSYDMYINMKESKRRMSQRLKGASATIAVLERELEKLTRMLKSGRYKEREELLDEVERIAGIVQVEEHEQNGQKPHRQTRVEFNGDDAGGRQTAPASAGAGDGGD
jgi:hypothetical protein